jgi:putative ABC transport system permease protein
MSRLDFRSAFRSLKSAKAVTLTAAGMMALGIGLNTAVSAVAYSVLLRPLPYRDASSLVVIAPRASFGGDEGGFRLPETRLWRERLRTVERSAAWTSEDFTIRGAGEPVSLRGTIFDGPLFETLGSRPSVGQPLDDDDVAMMVGPAIAARIPDGAIVGKSLSAAQRSYRVAAVMPREFAFPSDQTAFWIPARTVAGIEVFGRRDNRRFVLVGRMRPGVHVGDVEAEATRIMADLETQYGNPKSPRTVMVRRVDERLVASIRPVLRVFFAGGLIVLIIACANAATLLVGRALGRDREIAVKLALGAGESRLLQGFLLESGILATMGASAGIALAYVVVRAFSSAQLPFIPRAAEARIDAPVLLWSIATAVAVTLICGLVPALHTVRRDRATAFRRTTVAGSPAGRRVRRVLVVVQVTLATVLLVSASLLIRTVAGLARTDIGIEPTRALAMKLMITESNRFDAQSRGPVLRDLIQRVKALPGVRDAGVGNCLPPRVSQLQLGITLVNNNEPVVKVMTSLVSVMPGYLEALAARRMAGRLIENRDLDGSTHIAVLSASTARAFYPGQDPLGRELPFSMPGTKVRSRVVGVVNDIRYEGLETQNTAAIYVPWSDLPSGVLYLVVRTEGDPQNLATAVMRTARDVDPEIPVPAALPLTSEVAGALAERRMRAILGGGFAASALAVALVGLAGMLARLVVERRREIAIRAALGATPERTTRLVVAEGAALAGMGLFMGLIASIAAARGLSQLLYGVTPYDVPTYCLVACVLASLALIACYLPARRAATIEPVELLRSE